MTKYRIIGDIHGNYNVYKNLIKDVDYSIQVGDMGVGFGSRDRTLAIDTFDQNGPARDWLGPHKNDEMLNHRFIRGNHDNLEACLENTHWIPDGSMHDKFFCVGGALSIDAQWRTAGVNYWANEELTISELNKIISDYETLKPDYVITHECPESIVPHLFDWYNKQRFPSRTRQAFQTMFEIHKPKLWVFGHWHADRMKSFDNTLFVCLNEFSYIDVEV